MTKRRGSNRYRSAEEARRADVPSEPSPTPRPEYLFVVRESDRGHAALLKMYQQTLRPYVLVPGVQAALDSGLEPYIHPERWGGTRVGKSGTKGAIFPIGANWCLVVEGSAAQEDVTNVARWRGAENVFVRVLIDQLIALRPRKLVVAVFSRLVRSEEFSGPLQAVVKKHVEEVHSGEMQPFRPATDVGRNLWMMGTQFSSMERTALVRRMTTGALASAVQGIWAMPEDLLPFGYRLGVGGRVEPDPSLKSAVAEMIAVLGNPRLTYDEMIRGLSEAGVTSRCLARRQEDGNGDVARVRHSSSYLKGLVSWLPTYRTGEYIYRRVNPLPGETQLGGFLVEGAETDGVGYLQATYRFGLPEGGWASAEAFDAAEENWDRPPFRGGQAGPKVRPLTNVVAWDADGASYKLIGRSPHRYFLLRKEARDDLEYRTGEPAPAGHGWRLKGQLDGTCIASISGDELHRSIAESVMESIRDGVDAERLDGWATLRSMGTLRLVDARTNRIATLDSQITEAEARFRGARRLAAAVARNAPEDDDLDRRLAADVGAALDEVRQLQQEREMAIGQRYVAPDFGSGFDAEAAFIARAMANLATCEGAVHPDMARSLAEILQDFRMEVDGLQVHWTCDIMLVADGSVLRLPIAGWVPNRVVRQSAQQPHVASTLLERVFWEGEKLDDLLTLHDRERQQYWRAAMQDGLEARGLSRFAARIAFLAPPEVGKVLYGHVEDRELPPAIDSEWAAHILRVYCDPNLVWGKRWSYVKETRQLMLDAVQRLGGVVPFKELLEHVPEKTVFHMTAPLRTRERIPPSFVRLGRWSRGAGIPSDRAVALIPCLDDYCDGLCSVAIWVPESAFGTERPASVICPKCLRLPVPDSPRFPESYLKVLGQR